MRLESGARFEYRKSTSGHPDYVINQDKKDRILKILIKWDDRFFEEIEKGQFAKLEIDNGDWGNLEFLKDPRCSGLSMLSISDSANIDSLVNLNYLTNLKYFGVNVFRKKRDLVFDANNLNNLESLSLTNINLNLDSFTKVQQSITDLDLNNVGLKNLDLLSLFPNLKVFGLGSESKISDLSGLSILKKLTYLNVGFLPCESLVCVDELPELEELWIIEMRKLESVKVESVHPLLNKLFINSCGRLNDYSFISKLYGIEKLGISCKEINSLSFIKELPNLSSFHFGNSKVVDGNLSFLDVHKDTADIGFGNKRHYNRKSKEYRNF